MHLPVYASELLVAITSLGLSIYSLGTPDWIRFDTPPSSPLHYSSTHGLRSKCDRSGLGGPGFVCRAFPDRARDCGPQAGSSSFSSSPLSWSANPGDSQLGPRESDLSGLHNDTHAHHLLVPVGSGLVEIEDDSVNLGDGGQKHSGGSAFGFCEKWNSASFCSELSVAIGVILILCTSLVLLGNQHRQQHGWKVCAGLMAVNATLQLISWVLVLVVFIYDSRFYSGSRLYTSFYISVATSALNFIGVVAIVLAGTTGVISSEDDNEPENTYQPIP